MKYFFIYYCNIRISYKIKKVVENIFINIIDHKGKSVRRKQVCRDYVRWTQM